MSFIAPVITAATTALSGTALATATAGLSIVSTIMAANYQRKAAAAQAKSLEEDAKRERFRGQVEQQEQDFAAMQQLAAEETQMAASGFDLGSGSFQRSRTYRRVLARRDSMRIRNQAETKAVQLENRAEVAKSESSFAATSGLFGAAAGALELGATAIDGTSAMTRKRSRSVRSSA